jgi:hypothetical protein
MADRPPKTGDLISCVVTGVLSWGAKVRYQDYSGTARGRQPAVGERIRVRVEEVDGSHFKSSRID